MEPVVLDETFYERYPFSPDPADPVDRWCQLPQSASCAAVGILLDALDLGGPGRVLLDPFCGAGSTLLAGARSGRRVVGTDLEPMAALASALKLAAPLLVGDLDGRRWADRAAALVDRLAPDRAPGSTAALIAADLPLMNAWTSGDHRVMAVDATEAWRALPADGIVDVFTSPPHDTGRSSLWERVDPDEARELLLDAPGRLAAAAVAARGGTRDGARTALGSLLRRLRGDGQLGRVAVEYESSVSAPDADQQICDLLGAAGLVDVTTVPLYRGSPDGTAGVVEGGLVTGRGRAISS